MLTLIERSLCGVLLEFLLLELSCKNNQELKTWVSWGVLVWDNGGASVASVEIVGGF